MANKKHNNRRIVKIGVVGVDTGQLIIGDPSYLEGQFKKPQHRDADHAHTVYRHKDGSLWQYTYGGKPSVKGANKFPGSYEDVILKYKKTPNRLIADGDFEPTDIDPTPHIPEGEFSYRGICKATTSKEHSGQLNYALGHAGVAVAFSTGFGDGVYDVYAELTDTDGFGERIRKVWVEFF